MVVVGGGGFRDDIDRDYGDTSEMQSYPPACAADGSEDLPHVGPPGQLRLHLRKLRPDSADKTQQTGGKRVQQALLALCQLSFSSLLGICSSSTRSLFAK